MFASEKAERKVNLSTKIFVTVTFLLMVTVNILANRLPINGQTTAEVSEAYPNLFTPAGVTFGIWGLIYFLLMAYTLYQLNLFGRKKSEAEVQLLEKIGKYFALSSIANAAWIFAWHYHYIGISMLLMIIILVCLILINQEIKNEKRLSLNEKIFIQLPFSIYFAWITVATIANATTLLVSLDWDGWGISEPTWAAIMIFVGWLIGSVVMLSNKDMAYGLVFIWAYFGILIKHTSESGFSSQYPIVIFVTIFCIVLFILEEIYLLFMKRKKTTRG